MQVDEEAICPDGVLGRNVKSGKLFHEIFQDTSLGDVGIEIPGGPLLRCHSLVLEEHVGFITKLRECPKINRSVTDVVPAHSMLDEIKKDPRLLRLKKDVEFSMFSLDAQFSCLKIAREPEYMKLRKPGYTTATPMSGTTGSYKTRDIFALAERYELKVRTELVVELLRFIYQGEIAYFHMHPNSKEEEEELKDNLLELMFLTDRMCVDELFSEILEWFRTCGRECCGELEFVDAFYRMEYYHRERTADPNNRRQINEVLMEFMADRNQLRAVTRDTRWMSMSIDIVEQILNQDNLAIGAEGEILGLVERWNVNADKSKADLCRLLSCFRADASNVVALNQAFQNLGYPTPWAGGYTRVLGETKPRDNLSQREMSELMKEMAEAKRLQNEEEQKKKKEQKEAVFLHFEDGILKSKGFNFQLMQKQTIVQNLAIRQSGIYRIRVAFSQMVDPMWNPAHEMFCGVIFGNKYFGYIVAQSPYTGVFRLQNFSSYAPKPGGVVNLTGSGTKVEFDLELGVSMQRVNKIVSCSLSIESNNTTLISCPFQIHRRTLMEGSGLRFQILGSLPPPGSVDVIVSWVGGV